MRQIQNDCFCECAFKVRYIDTIIPISSSLAKFNVDVDQNKTLDYSQSVYTKHFWNTKLFFDNHIFGKSIYTNISLYSMVSNCKLFSEYGSSPSLYFIFVIISDHLFKQVLVDQKEQFLVMQDQQYIYEHVKLGSERFLVRGLIYYVYLYKYQSITNERNTAQKLTITYHLKCKCYVTRIYYYNQINHFQMSVNGKTMYAQTKSINNEIQKSANQYQKQKEMLEVTQVIMDKCLSKKSYLTNLTWFEKIITRNAAQQYSEVYSIVAKQVLSTVRK
ncbi:Hypothetical_protein [Hexamita inflata]|uniref:Hypothetical_protein n=1 Tax=Hexamita inflata TaxID=28002 RepID=A0ABP1JEG9_9EUKA